MQQNGQKVKPPLVVRNGRERQLAVKWCSFLSWLDYSGCLDLTFEPKSQMESHFLIIVFVFVRKLFRNKNESKICQYVHEGVQRFFNLQWGKDYLILC